MQHWQKQAPRFVLIDMSVKCYVRKSRYFASSFIAAIYRYVAKPHLIKAYHLQFYGYKPWTWNITPKHKFYHPLPAAIIQLACFFCAQAAEIVLVAFATLTRFACFETCWQKNTMLLSAQKNLARHGVEDLVSLGARCRLPAAPWSLGPGKLMSTFVRRLRRWCWSPSPLSHDLAVLRHDDRKTQGFWVRSFKYDSFYHEI